MSEFFNEPTAELTEFNKFAPLFDALGLDCAEMCQEHMFQHSEWLDKPMTSIQHVYDHCLAALDSTAPRGEPRPGTVEQPDTAAPAVPQTTVPSTEARKRLRDEATRLRMEHRARVAAASKEWHEAVEQRREAMVAWNRYVDYKKALLDALKST